MCCIYLHPGVSSSLRLLTILCPLLHSPLPPATTTPTSFLGSAHSPSERFATDFLSHFSSFSPFLVTLFDTPLHHTLSILGNNVIYDVSIVDPSGHAYSQLAAKQAGEAAKTAKKNKINKYAALCSGRAVFVPLIFESTGFIEEDVRSVLSGLRRRETDGYDCIPEYSTWAAPDAQQYWLQRISIALQRGNALCVLQALETRRTGCRTIAY